MSSTEWSGRKPGTSTKKVKLWSSQGLARNAWLASYPPVSAEAMQEDFSGAHYFTDGYAVVLWLSEAPISMLEREAIDWDDPTQ